MHTEDKAERQSKLEEINMSKRRIKYANPKNERIVVEKENETGGM